LKIYHFDGGRSESERFFDESLTDFIKESGLDVPEEALSKGTKLHKGPRGKPYFSDPELERIYFSRSHSKGHEVVCFSEKEIGIDCENTKMRPGIEVRYMDIAVRCFTEDELEYVREAAAESGRAEGDPLERFFEVWTAKEAYMKYTGNGFSEGFRTFSVLNAPDVKIETGRLTDAPHIVYSVCTARADK